ncbi:MAG: response regulator transcription factor [Planctomycetota bacterium]
MVLRLIMDGKTFKEIGEILHRTTSTINFHRRNIYDKFGVNNKTELIKRCAEMELL